MRLRVSKHASVVISQVLTWVIFILMAAVVFLLPSILKIYSIGTSETRTQCLVILYFALAVAFIADISLHFLLLNIRKEAIFTSSSVKYLRILSWCCFGECIIFFALAFFLSLGILLAFACAFMGMILRVVKNVIEEAADIKNEHDYTI